MAVSATTIQRLDAPVLRSTNHDRATIVVTMKSADQDKSAEIILRCG